MKYNQRKKAIILLEDGQELLWEDATINDETKYFVSEESTQIGSFNIIAENNDRLVDETDSLPLLLDDALMIGQKESNQSGPTIGDLGDMMFTENYSMMNKIQLDGGSGISSGDDLLLETGEHCLLESPSEGISISDISILYTLCVRNVWFSEKIEKDIKSILVERET